MGQVRSGAPTAQLFFAVFSQSEPLIERARDCLADRYGAVDIVGPTFLFDDTEYYERSMGANLRKFLFSVDRTIAQNELAEIKIETNKLEVELSQSSGLDAERPINIDPGMVDLGKVMLASTKSHAHRIYVAEGIFVEVTLYLAKECWEPWPWTYRDYRRPEVHAFLHEVRARYRERRDIV